MPPGHSANPPTIVIVNSGDGTGLNFCRSLQVTGRYALVGVDTSLEDHLTSEAERRYLIDGVSSGHFIADLNKICRSVGADLLYAADTNEELIEVFRGRQSLDCRTFLPCQDDLITENKWKTYLALTQHGIRVPETVLVENPDDLRQFMSRHGTVWLRCIHGSGGAGSIATDDVGLACGWIDRHDGWRQFTAAEQLGRRMATWTGLWYEGQLQVCQLRERLSWKYAYLAPSGVTGITGVQRTIWNEGLHDLALRCVRAVSRVPHSIFSVDFTWHKDGTPCPTEIQASRFYTTVHFFTLAGLNFPDEYCRLALGHPPRTEPLINPIRETLYWIRAVDRPPRLMTEREYRCATEPQSDLTES